MAPPPQPRSKSLPWRRRLVVLLVLAVVASVIARVATASPDAEPQSKTPAGAMLVPQGEPPPEEPKPEGGRQALPYVTEGGIAMLLGLGLGIATRMLFRMTIFFLVVVFVAVQYMAFKGVLTVDWGRFAEWTQRFVLNVSSDHGIGAIVQHKLPSAGSLLLGLYLGLKR